MKYVLVTGAYGGMGYAAVNALKNRGYFVFALDRTVGDSEALVMPIKADLTKIEDVKRAYETVKEACDGLYAIIHFAGCYDLDSLVEISEERYLRIFDINVFAAYRVNKEFLPLLGNGSRIIITTSELAPLDPLPFTGAYAISKSTLDKYAHSLGAELSLLGIRVSVIRPGAVETDMLGASTTALDRFCNDTKLYSCNAKKFRDIVDAVEARSVKAEKIGDLAVKILEKRRPRAVYKINRNPLLLLLNLAPRSLARRIIKFILK